MWKKACVKVLWWEGTMRTRLGRGKKGQNLHKHSIEVRESLMGDEAAAVSQEVGKKWNVLNQGYVIRFVLGIYQLSQVI